MLEYSVVHHSDDVLDLWSLTHLGEGLHSTIGWYKEHMLLNRPHVFECEPDSGGYEQLASRIRKSCLASLKAFLQNVEASSHMLFYELERLGLQILKWFCDGKFGLTKLWVEAEEPDWEDVVDHFELPHMPMEVVMDLTLLAFYEPAALSEEVIAHVFAKVESL